MLLGSLGEFVITLMETCSSKEGDWYFVLSAKDKNKKTWCDSDYLKRKEIDYR